jgi:hypothetical protein
MGVFDLHVTRALPIKIAGSCASFDIESSETLKTVERQCHAGASTSSMIRSFSSAGQCRRRSTIEMISDRLSITVLDHVGKEGKPHDPQPLQKAAVKARLPWSHEAELIYCHDVLSAGQRFGLGHAADRVRGGQPVRRLTLSTRGVAREKAT